MKIIEDYDNIILIYFYNNNKTKLFYKYYIFKIKNIKIIIKKIIKKI